MIEIEWPWIIVLLIVVVGVLFFTGKIGRFKYKSENVEVEMEEPSKSRPPTGSTDTTNIQVGEIKGTKGDVHIGDKIDSKD